MPDYPFVRSHVDLGTASGPRLAVAWHMAEGGGTVGFLSRPNVHGVSVHFVVEKSGRTVQMLQLSHMHTSIRVTAIRTSDDDPYDWNGKSITYGGTATKAVLGTWRPNPNNATIGVEVEGFARDGPNEKQTASIAALWDDMASRFPKIRSLGHRDFASYKACPGKKYPWDLVGGHGPATEDDVPGVKATPIGATVSGLFRIPGTAVTIPTDGSDRGSITGTPEKPAVRHAIGLYSLDDLAGRKAYLITEDDKPAFIAAADGTFTEWEATLPPDPLDCAQQVTAAVTADRAKAKITYEGE